MAQTDLNQKDLEYGEAGEEFFRKYMASLTNTAHIKAEMYKDENVTGILLLVMCFLLA